MEQNIMKHVHMGLGIILASVLSVAVPAMAEAPTLDPVAAAGKIIFEETAGGVGCKECHGMNAEGDVGPNIVGQDAVAILAQLQTNENMGFIELTEEEIDQVAAYLRYLHDLEAH